MDFQKYLEKLRNKEIKTHPIIRKSLNDVGDQYDSGKFYDIWSKNQQRFVPPIDFSSASNFAFYGLAEEYYKNAIKRVYNTYPYDGTPYAKELWHHSSSFVENYIFDNEYPRTTGWGVFSPDGWTAQAAEQDGYGEPTTKEYILLDGAVNINNLIDEDKGFGYNLEFGNVSGSTIEFWLKKSEFLTTLTEKEVLFDIWNSGTIGSSDNDYGRLTLGLTSSAGGTSPFFLVYNSGTSRIDHSVFGSLTTSDIADDAWHHYAITLTSSVSDQLDVKLYVDGDFDSETAMNTAGGAPIGAVTGAFVGAVGSLVTQQSGSSNTRIGWGKLSGSLDEFRFWKKVRTPQQIGRFYIQPVGAGGDDIESVNRYLGVYYKFNEGITETASVDQRVLDYSGRVNNGSWEGYTANARSTGSAIVQSGKATKETKDPILYSFQPEVKAYYEDKVLSGSIYDRENYNSVINKFPGWIREEDENADQELRALAQILGSVLDEIYLEIKSFPSIANIEYYQDDVKQPKAALTRASLNSKGFVVGPILDDVSEITNLLGRTEKVIFTKNIEEIKSTIYNNLNNNLMEILKTKGTEASFRNIMRCFGVDTDLISINTYFNLSEIDLEDRFETFTEKNKYFPFSDEPNVNATVYINNNGSNQRPYISGTYVSGNTDPQSGGDLPEEATFANTYEVNAFFKKQKDLFNTGSFALTSVSSSVFGIHAVNPTDPQDSTDTFAPGDDYANFQVYAVRDQHYSSKAKFVLTTTNVSTGNLEFPEIETDYYSKLYDNSTWQLAVKIKPESYPYGSINDALGLEDDKLTDVDRYRLIFYGVHAIGNTIIDSFSQTASINYERAVRILSQPRKLFIGAHRTNFTGSVLKPSDVDILSARVWTTDLKANEINSHAFTPNNLGLDDPFSSEFGNSPRMSGSYVSRINTLLLNWGTYNLSSSDDSGQFIVTDLSSGSFQTDNYWKPSWYGDIVGAQHDGLGYGFQSDNSNIYNTRYLNVVSQKQPLQFSTAENVKILDVDMEAFQLNQKPEVSTITFEKSLYHVISRDILKFFAGVSGFNELIGDPVNKYRLHYKDLRKLAQTYFRKVSTLTDINKFFDYYNWIDNSLNQILLNVTPASLDSGRLVSNVVESHVLERSKYDHKFPTLEFRRTDPEIGIEGINKSLINWKFSHAPLNKKENTNCFWWAHFATTQSITSGDADVHVDKQKIFDVKSGSFRRAWTTPYKFDMSFSDQFHGGANFPVNKNTDYWKPALPHSDLIVTASGIAADQDCDDNLIHPELKKAHVRAAVTNNDGEFLGSSKMLLPFSLITSSFDSVAGYRNNSFNNEFPGIAITNIHIDGYGENNYVPLQGIWTARHIGGSKVIGKTPLNSGSSHRQNRAELYDIYVSDEDQLALGKVTIHNPQQRWGSEPYAKAPLSIKNIKTTTGTVPAVGNYSKNYEIVQTSGRNINNIQFVHTQWNLDDAENFFVSGVLDYELPLRDSGSDSVIAEIFNAPGGPDTAGGFLDTYSGQFSVYNDLNYRNLIVRQALNSMSLEPMAWGGYIVDSDQESASFHKTPRGYQRRLNYSSGDTIATATLYNNYFFQECVPGSVADYAWISASMKGTASAGDTTFYDRLNSIMGYQTASDQIQFPTGTMIVVPVQAAGVNEQEPVAFNYFNTGYNEGITVDIAEPIYQCDFAANRIEHNTQLWSTLAGAGGGHEGAYTTVYHLKINEGPYGYPSFKQLHKFYHPILAYQRRNNVIGIKKDGVTTGKINEITKDTIRKYVIPPLTLNYPADIRLNVDLEGDDKEAFTQFRATYLNDKTAMLNLDINKYLTNGNDVELQKSVVEGTSPAEKLMNFYSDPSLQSVIDPDSFINMDYKQSIYPRVTYTYLSSSRQRDNFLNQFWRDTRRERSDAPPTPNPMGFDLNYKGTYSEASFLANNPTLAPSCSAVVIGTRGGTEWFNFNIDAWANTNKGPDDSNFLLIPRPGPSRWVTDADIAYSDPSIEKPEINANVKVIAGDKYVDLRNLNFYPPNAKLVADVACAYGSPFDPRVANAFSYGILKDVKSVIPRYIADATQNHAQGTAICTDPTGALNSASLNTALCPTHSYGPLLAMPYALTITSGSANDDCIDDICKKGKVYLDGLFINNALTQYKNSSADKRSPFYRDYDHFAEKTRIFGKAYTIVPEYISSNHIEDALKKKSVFNSEFNYLEITGSVVSSSLEQDFVKRYLNSDRIFEVKQIKEEHAKFAEPWKVTISAEAVLKLLPYDGFYPADRTVQIATLFSQSYSPYVALEGNEPTFRTFMQPFFMPGILYNSIKAGLAMDYGIFTSSYDLNLITQSIPSARLVGYDQVFAETFSQKLPFEQLLNPDRLAGKDMRLVDLFPHQSMSMNSTASWNGFYNPQYGLAVNNFLASTVDFFLTDGRMTTLLSKPQKKMEAFGAGRSYGMEVVVSLVSSSVKQPLMYENENTWGPMMDGRRYVDSIFTGRYATSIPYAPPWFFGSASVFLEFNPGDTKKYVIADIQEELSMSFTSSFPSSYELTPLVIENLSSITASVNVVQTAELKRMEYNAITGEQEKAIDPADDSFTVWAIQPRWETPYLSISDEYMADPTYFTQSNDVVGNAGSDNGRGIWNTLLNAPDAGTGEGLYIQIRDMEGKVSLKDMLGFEDKKRVGTIRDDQRIEEALVCIPYAVRNGEDQFFTLRRNSYDEFINQAAKTGVENEWSFLDKQLKRFKMPPRFDFVNDPLDLQRDAIGMIMFEFSVELDRTDLGLMWQGLPPTAIYDTLVRNKSRVINLKTSEMLQDRPEFDLTLLDTDVQWMVFKVKQVAKNNYFSLLADGGSENKFDFDPLLGANKFVQKAASYNWPYDYCSVVESAKIDVVVQTTAADAIDEAMKIVAADKLIIDPDKININNQESINKVSKVTLETGIKGAVQKLKDKQLFGNLAKGDFGKKKKKKKGKKLNPALDNLLESVEKNMKKPGS